MDEKDYELLHALDETRNITHAADKLYMTQSALSKRIKALEQELRLESGLRSRPAPPAACPTRLSRRHPAGRHLRELLLLPSARGADRVP